MKKHCDGTIKEGAEVVKMTTMDEYLFKRDDNDGWEAGIWVKSSCCDLLWSSEQERQKRRGRHDLPKKIIDYVAGKLGGRTHISRRGVPLAVIPFGDKEASVCWFFRDPVKGRDSHKLVVRHPYPADKQDGKGFPVDAWPKSYTMAMMDPYCEQIKAYLEEMTKPQRYLIDIETDDGLLQGERRGQ